MSSELLFPIMLEVGRRVIGASVEWGTKRMLNATIRCPNGCVAFVKTIPNRNAMTYRCNKCKMVFHDQYSIATNNTVRSDKSLVAAHGDNFTWEVERGFFGGVKGYIPKMDVQTINSKNHDMYVTYSIRERNNSRKLIIRKDVIVYSNNQSNNIRGVASSLIPQSDIPSDIGQVVLEADIANSYGDVVHASARKVLVFSHEDGAWLPPGSRA